MHPNTAVAAPRDRERDAIRAGALRRRLEAFPERFRHRVRTLALRHARLAELAESFPALLFALAIPRAGSQPEPTIAGVIRRHGKRVATLRLAKCHGDPQAEIAELKAAGNSRAPEAIWWAARRWINAHPLPQVVWRDGESIRQPLPRANWIALWRPYWLAKRRLPGWLPLAASWADFYALDIDSR